MQHATSNDRFREWNIFNCLIYWDLRTTVTWLVAGCLKLSHCRKYGWCTRRNSVFFLDVSATFSLHCVALNKLKPICRCVVYKMSNARFRFVEKYSGRFWKELEKKEPLFFYINCSQLSQLWPAVNSIGIN